MTPDPGIATFLSLPDGEVARQRTLSEHAVRLKVTVTRGACPPFQHPASCRRADSDGPCLESPPTNQHAGRPAFGAIHRRERRSRTARRWCARRMTKLYHRASLRRPTRFVSGRSMPSRPCSERYTTSVQTCSEASVRSKLKSNSSPTYDRISATCCGFSGGAKRGGRMTIRRFTCVAQVVIDESMNRTPSEWHSTTLASRPRPLPSARATCSTVRAGGDAGQQHLRSQAHLPSLHIRADIRRSVLEIARNEQVAGIARGVVQHDDRRRQQGRMAFPAAAARRTSTAA